MRQLTDTEIKFHLTEILLYFHHFCQEHNLTYSLMSGTLLGAVRHKGFIPWDDDIDVAMPRRDYEKLREIYAKEVKPNHAHYVLHDFRSNPRYSFPFLKLSDENTELAYNSHDEPFKMGLFVDIFPFDGLPKSPKKALQHLRHIRLLRNCSILSSLHTNAKGRSLGKRCIVRLFKLLPHGNDSAYWCDKIDRCAQKYKGENCAWAADTVWGETRVRQVKSDLLEHIIPVEFEGHQLMGPKDYDHYLTETYGDYMTPPPPEQQRSIYHMQAAFLKED